DEEDRGLRAGARPEGVDLIVSAGDLPFDYLEDLADQLGCPGVLVPGNHDPDGRVVDVAGLRFAGLGGCVRYREGPNQWTQREQARRARSVVRAAQRRSRRDGRPVDVVLTHAPPRK